MFYLTILADSAIIPNPSQSTILSCDIKDLQKKVLGSGKKKKNTKQ